MTSKRARIIQAYKELMPVGNAEMTEAELGHFHRALKLMRMAYPEIDVEVEA